MLNFNFLVVSSVRCSERNHPWVSEDGSWGKHDMYLFWVHKMKGQGHKGSFLNKWFPIVFLITSYHRAMIVHRLFGLGENMTPIDFEITKPRSQ